MTIQSTPQEHLESPVLSQAEAARYIGVGLRTLQVLAAQSKIPRLRLSARRVGFLKEDLDDYLKQLRAQA